MVAQASLPVVLAVGAKAGPVGCDVPPPVVLDPQAARSALKASAETAEPSVWVIEERDVLMRRTYPFYSSPTLPHLPVLVIFSWPSMRAAPEKRDQRNAWR